MITKHIEVFMLDTKTGKIKMKHDDLGDRMKAYEGQETHRKFLPMVPVYARLDGRGFSKFTRDLERPWDNNFWECMNETTKFLVEKTNAVVGYHQSDEISLIWLFEDYKSQMMFDGKIQKLCSVLSGMATSHFTVNVMEKIGSQHMSRYPHFDCRVFQVPSKVEATNAILWRYLDAKKNSVSMMCRHYYSAKAMHLKNQPDMIEMINQKAGEGAYDAVRENYKTGTFVRRFVNIVTILDNEDKLVRVPRSSVNDYCVEDFHKAFNRTAIVFDGEAPQYEEHLVDIGC